MEENRRLAEKVEIDGDKVDGERMKVMRGDWWMKGDWLLWM